MLAVLKIEAMGDSTDQYMKFARAVFNEVGPGLGDQAIGKWPARYWVARITGKCPRYKWKREFIRGKKDYSQTNSVGSRGVYIWYFLESGNVYEVNAPVSWKNNDRYFCRVTEAGDITRITESDVELWLKDHSE